MELARQTLIKKKLYKFRALSGSSLEHTRRIFTHNELYFPSPADLNDPWECKPVFRVQSINDPVYRMRLIRWIVDLATKYTPGLSRKEAKRQAKKHTQEELQSLVEQTTIEYQGAMQGYRICSFSSTETHPLLWSHYADSHKGLCLEFDASTDIFGGAMKVTYSDEYPSLDLTSIDMEAHLEFTVLTKSTAWAHEMEYRLISAEPNNGVFLAVENHIFNFPAILLTGVTLGCQMSEEHRLLVKDWVIARRPQIRFKEAIKSKDRYQLEFRDVPI